MVDIEKIQAEIVQRLLPLNPQKIILFGSYADGTARDDSDIDMLVIHSFEGNCAVQSAKMRLMLSSDYPIDLLVRRPEQVQRRLEMNDCFFEDILEHGKVLYEADNN